MGSLLKEHADENFHGPKRERPLGHHSSIIGAKNYIEAKGLDFDKYFTFTLTRNPWSREYSQFNYRRLQYNKHTSENTFSKLSKRRQKDLQKSTKYPDFKSFLLNKSMQEHRKRSPEKHLTISKIVAVKYVAKLENLDESLRFLSDKIGIDITAFPHSNKRDQKRRELKDVYDREMVEASLRLFAWEIKNLNYDFDSCAHLKC